LYTLKRQHVCVFNTPQSVSNGAFQIHLNKMRMENMMM